ncbi:hypothetical protein E2C01_003777 [Portunus trituberculatus]|uniref:Secreted protein n=1 Tax=Portunus trituberculatus TaxID=210409 RepID=A0A5B7CN10_PORTR|nr:hypothetical protein [Portunus trituberculatus]
MGTFGVLPPVVVVAAVIVSGAKPSSSHWTTTPRIAPTGSDNDCTPEMTLWEPAMVNCTEYLRALSERISQLELLSCYKR